MIYSGHTFICPFKWSISSLQDKPFTKQVDLSQIEYAENSQWIRSVVCPEDEQVVLYNEKNFFYEFVHPVLYDDGLAHSVVRHFERRELHDKLPVKYHIKHKGSGKVYVLDVVGMTLNLYATGVGTLIFNMHNTSENQKEAIDILRINQFGRRFVLPFYADKEFRTETAEYLEITGLIGSGLYREDFNSLQPTEHNKPACFIIGLIKELVLNATIEPVVDDRMFVVSWIANNNLTKQFAKEENETEEEEQKRVDNFLYKYDNNFWHQFVFIDGGDSTCQNDKMCKTLMDSHTYTRWQKWGTLYGLTRYAMTMVTGTYVDHLKTTMDTIYTRMAELALVQRASILRFSGEITRISKMQDSSRLSSHISSLYSSYIRFVNQIYFREITAQEQGIELYDMLRTCMETDKHVEKLDNDIEEMFSHVSLLEEHSTNKQMKYLTWIATIFVPGAFAVAIFGMNNLDNNQMHIHDQLSWVMPMWGLSLLILCLILGILNKKRH